MSASRGDEERGRVPPDIGLLVREYEPIREVGRGGMGAVVLARHRMASHEVAIKISAPGAIARPDALARITREAKLLASLRHPNIVRLYDVVDIGRGRFAIVMEYVRGESLANILRESGALPVARCRSILADVGAALEHAHERGVIHRDVKPANVLVHRDSWAAKLCDFGIARGGADDSDVTNSGVVAGTPAYMSPEHIDGKRLDPRTDIYSLGLLAWELLTGQQPWRALPLFDVLYHQKHSELPDVRSLRPDVSDGLAFALEGALAKEPQLRWLDATEFLEQLYRDQPTERLLTLRADRRAVEEGNLELERDFTLDLPIAQFVAPEKSREYPILLPVGAHDATSPVIGGDTTTQPFASSERAAEAEAPIAPDGDRSFSERLFGDRVRAVAGVSALATFGALAWLVAVFGPTLRPPAPELAGAAPSRAESPAIAPQGAALASVASTPHAPADARGEAASAGEAAMPATAEATTIDTLPLVPRVGAGRPPLSAPLTADARWGVTTEREAAGEVANPERARFESAMRVARRFERAGRLGDAESTLDRALAAQPHRGALYAMRAYVRTARGSVRDAWTDLEMAARMGERWTVLALETRLLAERDGVAFAKEELKDDVRAALEPPRMLDPDRAFGLARALLVVGDRGTAMTVLERTRIPDPTAVSRLDDDLLSVLSREPRFIALKRRLGGAP